ncbi:polyhomeotic-like protein 3 [Rhinoderma darwinii]|uniref:polyhomeotic-like protein 3 n=1 Tax=Rhinoderma darwinii TaxID=43563 RepID=UPI003F669283
MESEHTVTTTSPSPTTTTTSASHPPPISVYSSDRHAVQVIQQTLNRPPSSAAQYLQQMYAAQQQHLMLQTAALQQQHLSSAPLQSLASVPQAGVSGDRRSASPCAGGQQPTVPQSTLNLSTSPTPTQIVSRSQTSSTTSSSITQKTMLLGSTTPSLSASQAQMYLRAQMLIFTPAATVAAVQSDIPMISSSASSTSSQSSAAQVQNLTMRSPPILEISCPQNSPPKLNNHDQHLAMCHKTTVTSSKTIHTDSYESSRKGESPGSESRCTAVTRTASLHQLLAPVSYSSVQPHSSAKHQTIQLHPDPPKLTHHQMILQQQQQIQHRHQIQTITLHNPALESPSVQQCVPIQSPAFLSLPCSTHSHHSTPAPNPPPPSPTLSHSAQQSVVVSPSGVQSPCQSPTIIIHPQALLHSQPPLLVQSPLPSRENTHLQSTLHPSPQVVIPTHTSTVTPRSHAGPSHQQTIASTAQQFLSPIHPAHSSLQSLPPPIVSSPHLPASPPSQLQSLPLQSMQTISVQPEILTPGQVLLQNALLTEEELPAAEALVQLPFQTLPPPQTVAVNLHIPPAQVESPVVYQVEHFPPEEVPMEQQECVRVITQTPTPPTLSPPAFPVGSGEELPVAHIMQGLPSAVSSVSASVIRSPSDNSYASIPAPPLLLPAATTRSNGTQKPNSIPGLDNKLPQAIVKPQILTHVIEGFVIQEGLQPFPVSRSSLMVDETAKGHLLLDEQFMNLTDMESDIQSTAKLPDNSTDTDVDDLTAEEGVEELECEILECEFCGKTGYPNRFLRSKRFCSQSCAKRYNISGTKRLGLYKAEKGNRWSRKSEGNPGRRGRRPYSIGGSVRDHYLRQLPTSYSCSEALEDPIPVPMTTRLRRQSEREQELRRLQLRKASSPPESPPDTQTEPSLWTVEDVWAFIHSLPGCHEIADEFRTQEIDGQALLLLKEDHLMSTMNIKLGPALKICARINSLKET